ncbi:hypothetical protein [Parendozoicomonas sp. Alg238-R29]|uniref:hypothetical protein n=1 Tax=Parendozoicomonas sp. Alg238-R29 TaxID=2993446 RepID=UPI00248E5CB6|nr:hypothetical protein [Parendozoicomonas sp. Alg238-R29]
MPVRPPSNSSTPTPSPLPPEKSSSNSCKGHLVATVSNHDIYLEMLQPIMGDRKLVLDTLKEFLNIPQSGN